MTPTILRDDDPRTPAAVRDALETGQTLIFPTDTIYGMGGNPWDDAALAKVRDLKRRSADQPFTLHVPSVEDVLRYAVVQDRLRPTLATLLPGPYTVILPALAGAPACSRSDRGIGLRVPRHPFFSVVMASLGRPLFVLVSQLIARAFLALGGAHAAVEMVLTWWWLAATAVSRSKTARPG